MSLKQNDIYNENMRESFIEHNLYRYDTKPIKDQWDYNSCVGYKCVNCGREISPVTLKYFNYNIENILCYICQDKN